MLHSKLKKNRLDISLIFKYNIRNSESNEYLYNKLEHTLVTLDSVVNLCVLRADKCKYDAMILYNFSN